MVYAQSNFSAVRIKTHMAYLLNYLSLTHFVFCVS